MQHKEQKEEIKDQPITKEEDKKSMLKIILEVVFGVIIISLIYWKLEYLGISVKALVLISIASVIVIIYLNYTPQRRLELFKWKKEDKRRGLKTMWMMWLGLFLAFLSFLFYEVYPESDLWVLALIPAILLLATDMYRPSFLFKK